MYGGTAATAMAAIASRKTRQNDPQRRTEHLPKDKVTATHRHKTTCWCSPSDIDIPSDASGIGGMQLVILGASDSL